MAEEQRRVLFDGMVQGVGFRFTACRVAEGFDVTGYVRNLPSGKVECLLEGQAEEINRFLAELTQRMEPYIQHTTQQSAAPTGQFHGFTVRF